MIILITVLGILVAAIMIPPTHPASERSKMSRAQSDMRSLSIALEAYFSDQSEYPAERPMAELSFDIETLSAANGESLLTIEFGRQGLMGLTTPTAYMTSMFNDPFIPRHNYLAYYRYEPAESKPAGWILFSAGPNGKYQIARDDYAPATSTSLPLINKTYDPTNGLKSAGDIWRTDDSRLGRW